MRHTGNLVSVGVLLVTGAKPDLGEVMKPIVDRPWTQILTVAGGLGEGKQIMAHPSWGEDNNPIPLSVEVTVSEPVVDGVIGTIAGPFESPEHAERLALEFASKWYDKNYI